MGKLVQVATNTVTSAVASVTLTGIDSDDVYMVAMNNVLTSTGSVYVMRVQVGGTDQTGSHYDKAGKNLFAGGAFSNASGTNTAWYYPDNNTTINPSQAIHYIYNANNSSEYTFFSTENVNGNNSRGYQGGGVYKQASQVDGISILAYNTAPSNGAFSSGTFTLYKVL